MGLFASKIAKAKAAYGANYAREGRYWVIFNSGKQDMHASKNSEQIVFEGTVIRVVDSGPAAGARFKPTKGGNESPHVPGEPFTLHFGSWQLGAEARAKRFLLVAADMEESKLPAAINPMTGAAVKVAPGALIHPQTGEPVQMGTPGAIAAVDPVEHAIGLATNPSVNCLKDIVVEMHGRGQTTQGRGPSGKQDIIAVDPVRRIWATEVREVFESLHENAKQVLWQDKRLEQMLTREAQQRGATQASQPVASAPR